MPNWPEAIEGAATGVAAAIETAIGGELILGVGRPRTDAPSSDLMPSPPVRVLRTTFTEGASGGAYIVLAEALATRIEAAASDGQLLGALAAAFDTIGATLRENAGDALQFSTPSEAALDEVLAIGAFTDREHAVYSFLDGEERVGAFVVSMGPATAAAGVPPTIDAEAEETPVVPASVAPITSVGVSNQPQVALHQFQPLGESGVLGVDPRALSLLHDVEMGVTAELGRRRMTVRDLLALTPGSVIELDRAAGSPVDVLVNGTLIARGEVVVIDEEFGIRVSEIVGNEAGPASTVTAA